MIRKFLLSTVCVCALSCGAFAGFEEHYTLGHQYLENYQFASAIAEFQNALKINYKDSSARIGLVNSYLSSGSFSVNKNKDYKSASDAYRSALFYLLYYPSADETKPNATSVEQVKRNLEVCLNQLSFDKSAQNRFNTAKQLRAEGKFAAAGYEFLQAQGNAKYLKESYVNVAEIMRLLRNNPKAVEYYRRAVAIAPDDTDVRFAYAKMLDLTDAEDEAVNEFNYVLEHTDNNQEVLYALERIYRKKLDKHPSDANIITNMGAILQKEGKLDEALLYYAKAESLDNRNISARINTGTLYQQKKDYTKALEAYDSVLLLYPKNIQANLCKAETLEEMGNTQQALALYEKVLAFEPNNESVNYKLKNLLRKSLSTKAFIEYVKTHSTTGKPADELYLYALDLHKENKLEDAITIYKEVINLAPENSEVYVNLALAECQNKNFADAISILKIANVKFPANQQIRETIATVNAEMNDGKLQEASELYNAGKYQEAIKIYSNITPMTEEIMLTIATCWQNLGNIENALASYKKALDLNPQNADTAYYIATILIDNSGATEEGREYINKALAINPNHSDAKQLLAYLEEQSDIKTFDTATSLFDREQYDESLNLLNDLLAKNPNNAYALYYRGMIYDAKNNQHDAIKDYEKALKCDNNLAIVNYLLGVDYDAINQSKNALKYFETFLANYNEDDDFKAYANDRVKDLKNVK